MFTRSCLSLFTSSHYVSVISIYFNILPFTSRDLFPPGSGAKTLYAFLPSPMLATWSHLSYPPWFDHPNNVWWRSSSLCSFLRPPIASSLFGPNIPLSTLFSNTLSICSSLNVRNQVSYPYKTVGKIIVLYILIFSFLESRWEHRRLWPQW
jgi:hypothetical protein